MANLAAGCLGRVEVDAAALLVAQQSLVGPFRKLMPLRYQGRMSPAAISGLAKKCQVARSRFPRGVSELRQLAACETGI